MGAKNVYDIVIAGGGILGSSLGCLLHGRNTGYKIGIIEPNPPKMEHTEVPDVRVYTVRPASADVFKQIGIWDQLKKVDFDHMQVWEGGAGCGGKGFLRFDGEGTPLAHVVENREIQNALFERLTKYANSEDPLSLYQQKVSKVVPNKQSGYATVELMDGTILKTKLLVAADGANSIVRKAAGIGTWGWDYEQSAVVATVKTEKMHGTAWQRFFPTGPIALLPMRDGYSSIVWSCSADVAQELVCAKQEEFVQRLNDAFSSLYQHRALEVPLFSSLFESIANGANMLVSASTLQSGFQVPPHATEVVGQRASFPLRLNFASNYGRNGIALLGDAAHTIHPLAGQGLNLGLADVSALNTILLDAISSGSDLSSDIVLDQYQSKRKNENLVMAFGIDTLHRLYGPVPDALSYVRNLGLGAVNGIQPLKRLLIRKAMGY